MKVVLAFLVWLFIAFVVWLFIAFVVWLFSFHIEKVLFLRWIRWSPPSPLASGETTREEHLPSQEGQQELSRFLSSLPQDGCGCTRVLIDENERVTIFFGRREFHLHGTNLHFGYHEFLEAVASSKVVFREGLKVNLIGEKFCRYMEAFGNALRQSNNGLRKLDIYCERGSAIPFAKCVSSVVLKNNSIQDLRLKFFMLGSMGKVEVIEFMAIIALPYNLRILKLFQFLWTNVDEEGMEELIKPFKSPHNVLEEFVFDSITSDVHLEHISSMLDTSTSLKKLCIDFSSKKVFMRGYTSLAIALCSNESLKSLTCTISSSKELKVLLNPLLPNNNNVQCNTTLTKLQVFGNISGKEGIETLVEMLHTNSSLLKLVFSQLKELKVVHPQGVENVLAILKALKINKSLKKINFIGCTTVGGDKVLGAMMDLLLENYCIEDIGLKYTNMENSGDAEYIYSTLSKKKEMKLWDIVQGMANVNPTSGQVFLCGEPYAGKTRLRMSMKQSWQKVQEMEKHQNTSSLWKQRRIRFQEIMAPKASKDDGFLERTHGIEVDSVLCDGIGITIWDMTGQIDYHSFHELVMPNLSVDGNCSMFLLMSNPMNRSNPFEARNLQSIKGELEYWLRFIASNTRRSHSYRPHVLIVMTHFDYWKDDREFASLIEDVVKKLKSQFEEVLEFDEDKVVFKVDGTDVSHVGCVFDFIKSHLVDLLGRLPKTISACEEVQLRIAKWNANKSNPWLLKWDDFCESICKDVKDFNNVNHELAERRKVFVAISLNDGGHIIYNEKAGVVITNPHWFCHDIIGQFLYQCANKYRMLEMVSPNGIISIDLVKRLILDLMKDQGGIDEKFDDILGMMKKLNICYEQDAMSIMIPSFLKNNHGSLSWSRNDDSSNFKYIGRRLACKDRMKTMLTPEFFTRLQVIFWIIIIK